MDNVPSLLSGAQPFYLPGNNIGVVVVHGYTGTPANVRWLGDYLHRERGYTIYGPRLAGHGTHPDDLGRVHWREWYADVLGAYRLLCSRCTTVFVAGLSMGAALTLLLASHENPAGVIAMSTPYEIRDRRVPFIPLLKYVKPYRSKKESDVSSTFLRTVPDRAAQYGFSETGYSAYEHFPIASITQINHLLKAMRAGLPRIQAPTLLIHSKRDDVVPFEQFDRTTSHITCQSKQTLVLENSLHVLTLDVECITVFEAITQFIDSQLDSHWKP